LQHGILDPWLGRGTDVAMEEVVKRKVSMLHSRSTMERNGARFIGSKGNRYKFFWSGGDGASGVGI